MDVTIDRAGRIVVPKPLREAMRLEPGAVLEAHYEDGRLVLEPRPVRKRLARVGKGLVVVPDEPVPTLRHADVRAALESGRR